MDSAPRRPAGLAIAVAAALALLCAAVEVAAAAPPPPNAPESALPRATLIHDGRERAYQLYIPPRLLPPLPQEEGGAEGSSSRSPRSSALAASRDVPIVLAFHGARGDGNRFRTWTGGALERLADRAGFIVVYPDAFGGSWNDCRVAGSHPAKQQRIDDVGFVEKLVQAIAGEAGLERAPVFALGFSNGGHMAFRLALERPDRVAAVAAIGAHLPAPDESLCRSAGRAVPTLLISGTADPINPLRGGRVTLQGQDLGKVLSAEATADYVRRRAGLPLGFQSSALSAKDRPRSSGLVTPASEREDATRAEILTWLDNEARPFVRLILIHGGGHTIPGAPGPFPPFVGPTSHSVDAIGEAWAFFEAWSGRR